MKLEPENEDDCWFISEIGELPKPEGLKYDWMQL